MEEERRGRKGKHGPKAPRNRAGTKNALPLWCRALNCFVCGAGGNLVGFMDSAALHELRDDGMMVRCGIVPFRLPGRSYTDDPPFLDGGGGGTIDYS